MPFVAILTEDRTVLDAVAARLGPQSVAPARGWARLTHLVRERPVTAALLDPETLEAGFGVEAAIGELRRRFPSLATVLVVRTRVDPLSLFRLGRAGLEGLALLPVEGLSAVPDALRRAMGTSTDAVVTRAVSPFLPSRETRAVRIALECVQFGWNAEGLASQLGLTRPHVSVRLKACGLPSAGHIILWAKLLHGGRWLSDPGRTGQSVSRQLEYSSGAAFRRALRNHLGLTPTQVRDFGGLSLVLSRFLDECGLPNSLQSTLSVA